MARPVVDAVTPKIGTSAGGTSVLIQGSGFTGAVNVAFGFTSAIQFSVVDDNTITAITPTYVMRDESGQPVTQIVVDVIVTTGQGSSATIAGDLFEFVDESVPTYLDPIDKLSNLRTLIGERVRVGQQPSDTLFDDAELNGMIARHNGNLYLAAAEAWNAKAAEYADMVDVNESGSQRQLSQLFKQALAMSKMYEQAGIEWWRSTIERPVGRSASILKPGLGSPSDGPALGIAPVIADGFDPWFSPTARWWPLVTVMIGP
jgi:hypothetical protein